MNTIWRWRLEERNDKNVPVWLVGQVHQLEFVREMLFLKSQQHPLAKGTWESGTATLRRHGINLMRKIERNKGKERRSYSRRACWGQWWRTWRKLGEGWVRRPLWALGDERRMCCFGRRHVVDEMVGGGGDVWWWRTEQRLLDECVRRWSSTSCCCLGEWARQRSSLGAFLIYFW